MNLTETKMVLAVLNTAYPNAYRNMSPEEHMAVVNLWCGMFAEDDGKAVMAAVQSIIATQVEGFPPTIGAVKAKLAELREPQRMTAQEAWALASKAAAGNLAWEKLPPLVQRAIGSKNVLREWGLVEVEVFNTVIYSQFVKAYGQYEKRDREMKMIPPAVRDVLTAVADRLALNPKEEQRENEIIGSSHDNFRLMDGGGTE